MVSHISLGGLSTVLISVAAVLFTLSIMNRQDLQKQEDVSPFIKYRRPAENRLLETIGAVLMVVAIIVLFL